MGTAMQELIEFIESTNNTPHVSLTIIDKAKKLLEKEKEQTISFANEWYEEYCEGLGVFKTPEQYYNQTYKPETI